MSTNSSDVVVIGAGVVGSLLAYQLSIRGHRVTVVDKAGPCRGATSASFSWAHAHSKDPFFYHQFSVEAVSRYASYADELGIDIWLTPCWSIRPVFNEADRKEAHALYERRKGDGYRVEWLDGEETLRLVPQLSRDALGTSYYEGDALLDPFRLVFGAIHAARERGAIFRFGEEVTGFLKSEDRVTGVCTDKETIHCPLVVNAAGAKSGDVGRLAGLPIPYEQVKGEILLTERFPAILGGVVGDIRQTPAGNFMIGATLEPERQDTVSTQGNINWLAKSACRTFPFLQKANVIRAYAGVRPYPSDNLSVLGPTKKCEGFLWSTTHSGVTLAALMAEVISDFVEGKHHPSWDDRFSPDRFDA
jgi:sarcosine oxidase subunit beta